MKYAPYHLHSLTYHCIGNRNNATSSTSTSSSTQHYQQQHYHHQYHHFLSQELKHHLSHLPYNLRLLILDFTEPHKFILSAEELFTPNNCSPPPNRRQNDERRRIINHTLLIRRLYGYFSRDPTRSYFLLFPNLCCINLDVGPQELLRVQPWHRVKHYQFVNDCSQLALTLTPQFFSIDPFHRANNRVLHSLDLCYWNWSSNDEQLGALSEQYLKSFYAGQLEQQQATQVQAQAQASVQVQAPIQAQAQAQAQANQISYQHNQDRDDQMIITDGDLMSDGGEEEEEEVDADDDDDVGMMDMSSSNTTQAHTHPHHQYPPLSQEPSYRLKSINFSETPLSQLALCYVITPHVSTIRHLDLSHCTRSLDLSDHSPMTKLLLRMPHLRNLSIKVSHLGLVPCRYLSQLTGLTSCNIWAQVSDHGCLSALSQSASLTTNLTFMSSWLPENYRERDCYFPSYIPSSFRGNYLLQRLELSETPLTVPLCALLFQIFPCVKRVILHNCGITNHHIAAIVYRQMYDLPQLNRDHRHGNFSSIDDEIQWLLELLRRRRLENRTQPIETPVIELGLCENLFDSIGLKLLCMYSPHLTKLCLTENHNRLPAKHLDLVLSSVDGIHGETSHNRFYLLN